MSSVHMGEILTDIDGDSLTEDKLEQFVCQCAIEAIVAKKMASKLLAMTPEEREFFLEVFDRTPLTTHVQVLMKSKIKGEIPEHVQNAIDSVYVAEIRVQISSVQKN